MNSDWKMHEKISKNSPCQEAQMQTVALVLRKWLLGELREWSVKAITVSYARELPEACGAQCGRTVYTAVDFVLGCQEKINRRLSI